jgi:GH24 family phage-related lysozyme (muramidase)
MLLILLSTFLSLFSSEVPVASKILHTKAESSYDVSYNNVIDTLKKNEGFSAIWYNDKGYECIGYGQRKVFYRGTIESPVTKEQADKILRISFNNHIRIVRINYPELRGNKLIAVAHMSYRMGIGKINKNNLIVRKRPNLPRIDLDIRKLLSMTHPDKKFQVYLFYK